MAILLKTFTCEEFDILESSIDTEYFGFSSAKALLKKPVVAEHQQDQLLDFLRQFEFVMISNKASDPINNHWIGERTSAFLVDVNIQLRKELPTHQMIKDRSPINHESSISDQFPEENQIVHIAETYFTNSQFLNDPYLPKDKARCIYGDIAKNAFGKPGRFFAVTRIAGVVAGFLLFSMDKKASSSRIQLIAVAHDFTRQGIGQALIRSMENYVFLQGASTVFVGTQFNNFGALKLYHSNGYAFSSCSSIYHFWPMKA
jgi:ribosomal protein S18 acetylase RimI-like enzyme